MTHIINTLLVILAIELAAVPAVQARSVTLSWGYTPPCDPAVAGYNVYQDGKYICKAPAAADESVTCEVVLAKKVTTFTITAYFVDGTESPFSSPAYVYSDQERPVINSIRGTI